MKVLLTLEASKPSGKKYRLAFRGEIALGLAAVVLVVAKLF